MSKDKPQVFVSHSHADRDVAHKLIAELRRHNIAVQATDEMMPGKDWSCVERAIKGADAVIILVGSQGAPENFQLREWQAALEHA